MAADTPRKRISAMNIMSPWRGLGLVPVSPRDQGTRQSLLYLYSAILSDPSEGFMVGFAWGTNTLYGGEDGF